MRIAAIAITLFVVVFAAVLLGVTAPAAGQTIPPILAETPTATPCAGDCGPIPTPRPTYGTPEPTSTPDPNCPDGACGPIPTQRPIMGTPAPDCTGDCFPWPTPRPTYEQGAPIDPAQPGPGETWWHYSFMPIVGRR
jgi:hypothetical protein